MMYKIQNSNLIFRASDGAVIPTDTNNGDYCAYLAWLSEGNTPEPAEVSDPKIAIRAQIQILEQSQLLPRVTREFMLLAMEAQAPAEVLMQNPGYVAVKAFDNQVAALRALL
jgi:hypothetical protein